MTTPRTTRLVRVPHLEAFRATVVSLACDGPPPEARDRLVVVPTHAAAAHLLRSVENRLLGSLGAVLMPDLITPGELVTRLAERLPLDAPLLDDAEREVLLGVACRATQANGTSPPFQVRPALIAEILRFYDALRRHQQDVGRFERLALGMLEPGALDDRGAERLVRQTRFLVEAFRDFERRCAEAGLDEHSLRARLLAQPAPRPFRHLVVTVRDRAADPHGLPAADWDLLARLPGLERLDIVVTDTTLAGAFHERIHRMLPGLEEVRVDGGDAGGARLMLAPGGAAVHVARDREEEVAAFGRRVKRAARCGALPSLERAALVVAQPLPYVYVTREVLRSGGIPCQMFDALPLAAEPLAAALDLVFSAVATDFARGPAVDLLRSPHFRMGAEPPGESARDVPLDARDVADLDRALVEAGYLGDGEVLARLLDTWGDPQTSRPVPPGVLRAGAALLRASHALAPLRTPAPMADHLDVLMGFLAAYESPPGPDDPLRGRQLRTRGALLGTLEALRRAYRRFDSAPVDIDAAAALVRRWIEGQTFAPRSGEGGVHLVDAESARFGDFDEVQLAGLVDGEWPGRPARNIFYAAGMLRTLGWPAESDRLDGARATFRDLLRLPAARLLLSSFALDDDVIATPSGLLDEVESAGLPAEDEPPAAARIFEYEALALVPAGLEALEGPARDWAAARLEAPARDDPRFHGATAGHAAPTWSLTALERYQDCPFRFFAADVLRLEDRPDVQVMLTPRARGRLVHEVFHLFFEAWDRAGRGPITADRLDDARMLFAEVATPLLERLPETERALERTRLFGSAISLGVVDAVLGLEATRPEPVGERLLEYRLDGRFSLGSPDGQDTPLRGVVDRVDLLAGRRLRVIDYKSGVAPSVSRALQVPVYALCVQERLSVRDGAPWEVAEAAYISLTGKRTLVPVVKAGASSPHEALGDARTRVRQVLDGIGRGEFPPRPHDMTLCGSCAYTTVCRKDYVGAG